MPERVVFDTNVIVSGLLWRGKPYQCLLLARAGLVQAIYCREMLAELSRKLEDKFGFSVNRIQAVLYDWRRHAQEVRITGDLHVVTADPDDDKFIECAQTAGATVIVSGDRHLLNLGQYEGIVILSPAEFVARFNETSSIR
jgi:putative PIN family toxin of toxin-antitoxin system